MLRVLAFISLFSLGLLSAISAQIESPFSNGSLGIGQGNAFLGATGHSSILYNQAGIADLENLSFSVDAANLYNNSGLIHLHAAAIIPSKNLGTFALKIQSFGLEGYNYQNYSMTYARPLFRNFKLAATFNMYQFIIDNYGNSFVPNLEIGILTKINDDLSIGAHLANPLPTAISENTDFPTVLSLGVMYRVSTLVSVFLDVEKNIKERENLKIGLNYAIHPILDLRVGFNSFPGSFHFGAGINLKQININLGNAYHPILGSSTGLGIVYNLKK